ncbi:MAG: tRNA (adenosine(37)-N6)-threonylcarbamoyltransferase complex ATPase subunit type 1 TsaE [Candidatus Colwellbacteria bacterium]|nr:tRNA (adenosine(37)-N6)-threonylcarbamoyltransferase complex ATPase subunit type 1 TsaE [Candidatus Colwellbacteria bacterium]
MSEKIHSGSARETRALAETIAQELVGPKKHERAVTMGLVGDLGSGKTTFTQSLIKSLGVKKGVASPTFVIFKRFKLSRQSRFRNIYHIDAYRIDKKDLLDLGWNKMLSEDNIVVVEWADRVRVAMPPHTVWIRFQHGEKENERYITIN